MKTLLTLLTLLQIPGSYGFDVHAHIFEVSVSKETHFWNGCPEIRESELEAEALKEEICVNAPERISEIFFHTDFNTSSGRRTCIRRATYKCHNGGW